MEHAWKVCRPLKGLQGSNPCLSAYCFLTAEYIDSKLVIGFSLSAARDLRKKNAEELTSLVQIPQARFMSVVVRRLELWIHEAPFSPSVFAVS